ncbi:MAG: carbohydrate-binding domain-containing protein [Clostridiales bacterium]
MRKVYKSKKTMISLLIFTITLMAVVATSYFTANIYGATEVEYDVQNDWGGGATVDVIIYNSDSVNMDGWNLSWTFPGDQQIASLWNAEYTQSGSNVTVTNTEWNSIIPANGSISFGFNLTYSGTNTDPTDFVINGSSSSTATVKAASTTSTSQTTGTETTTPDDNSTKDAQITLSNNSISVSGSGAIASGNQVTISSAGQYSISGSISDGQIIVDTADEDKVEITLNSASINCSNSAPINIRSGEVILTLRGDNSTTDGESYNYDDSVDEEPNAAIFSKDDLTINGTGSITVNGNFNDGINCKDDLKISEGTINVTAVDDGLRGKESVEVNGGNITVNAQGDGIKADEENETEKGYVQIDGGVLNIKSGDDAINAFNLTEINDGTLSISATDKGLRSDNVVTVNGGNVNITKSDEGVEAKTITFNGGTTNIEATDDSLNATMGSRTEQDDGSQLIINDGELYLNSANGDSLDSNGSITIKGGTVAVHGPQSSIEVGADCNGPFTVSGGLVMIAGGNSSMTQYPDGASSQYSIAAMLTSSQANTSIICIKDTSGNELVKFKPKKTYYSIIFSSPDLKYDSTYSIYTGGTVSGGTETNGLITGGTYSGGTVQTTITINTSPTTTSGTFGGRRIR